MSVFASKHIEGYVMDYLQYLHGERELMFSTMANYLNALVVLAKWYDVCFVVLAVLPPLTLVLCVSGVARYFQQPLADLSFSHDCLEGDYVLAGLRRLRSQTNAKAKTEAVHKPLHPQWCRLRCRP